MNGYNKSARSSWTASKASWIESLFREQDLHAIFCSEWVAAAYAVTGLYPTDNVSRWNPNRLIRCLRWQGVAVDVRGPRVHDLRGPRHARGHGLA